MNKDLKVLIVDDEEAYCDVLGMILQTEGYQIKTMHKIERSCRNPEKRGF